MHVIVNTGDKSIKCLKKFTSSNLKPHQMIHSASKLHECVKCGKIFANKSGIIHHFGMSTSTCNLQQHKY